MVLDVADPATPSFVSKLHLPGEASGIDGDGNGDMAVANPASDNVSILLNNGDATFQSAINYLADDNPNSVYAADLDGDGDGDLVVANSHSSNVSVLINLTSEAMIENRNVAIEPNSNFLSQNYPNPFIGRTVIQYSLPSQSLVTIDIFDILGRKIETLAEGLMPAGDHQIIWDASRKSSGIYFYQIKAGDKVETKKMVLPR